MKRKAPRDKTPLKRDRCLKIIHKKLQISEIRNTLRQMNVSKHHGAYGMQQSRNVYEFRLRIALRAMKYIQKF